MPSMPFLVHDCVCSTKYSTILRDGGGNHKEAQKEPEVVGDWCRC